MYPYKHGIVSFTCFMVYTRMYRHSTYDNCLYAFYLQTEKNGKQELSAKREAGRPWRMPNMLHGIGKRRTTKNKSISSEGTDRLCSIYGCPHCYPVEESGTNRFCPVCKASVAPESYLIARLFDRSKTNKHVRILGCKQCRNG